LNLPFTVAKLHIMLIRAPISVPNHSSARQVAIVKVNWPRHIHLAICSYHGQ
jgi:hypothetical protein